MAHIATTASSDSSAAPFTATGDASSGASATDWASRAYSFLERPDSISSDATTASVLPVSLAGVVVPLACLEAALDVDELALRQELPRDLGQPVPGHARVVLRSLAVAAAVLVRRDREGRHRRRLH